MNKLAKFLSKVFLVLILIGGYAVYMTGEMAITSFKVETSFDDLLESAPEAGMHIKGDVPYVLACIGYEETWEENNGSRTPAETSAYYYLLPLNESLVAIEIKPDAHDAMEALLEETYQYATGGSEPATKVSVEGKVCEMEDDLYELYEDYMLESGYTEDNLKELGKVYVIETANMSAERTIFFVGIGLIVVGLLFFILTFVKARKSVNNSQNTTYQDMPYQNNDYESVNYQSNEYQTGNISLGNDNNQNMNE